MLASPKKRLNGMKRSTIHIFVDGTFHPLEGAGYGFVAVNSKGHRVYEQSEPIYDNDYQSSTCAEFIAALRAAKWAEKRGFKFVNIHYDYVGIAETAKSTNHRNGLHTQYFDFFQGLEEKGKTKVFFHKVKAHSNDQFNCRAHRLAKLGRKRNLRRLWLQLTKTFGFQHPAVSLFTEFELPDGAMT